MTITTTTSGATIRYTLDGSTPSETAGIVYSGPVAIGATATLNAIAYKSGLTDSPVTSGAYTILTGSAWGGTPYVTTYTYDVLNHLTSVSMPRGGTTQTRTFNYTSGTTVGALLLSATNPENGTVSYTYNSDQTLATKTDAKGQQFTYSYDLYKRLTSVSVGGNALRSYSYDSNPYDSSYSQYAAGRLAAIQYPAINYTYNSASASTTFTDMFTYTQAGQLAGKRLRVTKTLGSQTGSGNLNLAYAFNNEGKLTGVSYPTDAGSGVTPAFNYTYDSLMRLAGATDQNNVPIVSNVQYSVASQLTSINYYTASETRSYNSLLQLSNITTTVQGTTGINLTYNYPSGSNNGKINSMRDSISGETVTYQYDSLNRLISAAGSGWSQTQAYDGFGNLTGRTGSGTAQSTTMSTPADATTNRLTGYTYDANGNQISTGYTYDAENRIILANAGAVEYAYDAQNKRIWQATCTSSGNCSPSSPSLN